MTATLHEIARTLGGEVVRGPRGPQVVCPGPGHSSRDRSLAVMLGDDADVLVHSYAGDDWRACRDHVRDVLGLTRADRTVRAAPAPRPAPQRDHDATARALRVWREARDPTGSPVIDYLASHGVALPDRAAGEVIRFHPRCPWRDRRVPAMVALVRDVRTEAPRAIHRTALVHVEGPRRLSLGPLAGGAIKLYADHTVTLALAIGEGIETSLSLAHLPEIGRTPAWAMLSASGVAGLPVLSGIESLLVAVDHDASGAGQRAAEAVTARSVAAGAEVRQIVPRQLGADLNDLARTDRTAGDA